MTIDTSNMEGLICAVAGWAHDRNLITGATPKDQLTKTIEELGELAGGIARKKNTIIADSIGDVTVTLIILAEQHGMNFECCLRQAWEEIKDRKGRMIDGIFVKESDLKP